MKVKVKNRVVKAERKLVGGNALAGWILALKARIRKARLRAVLSANAELIRLYLDIGCEILDRVEKADWGSKVLETVSDELRREFPGLHGFSVRNLKYMKVFAREWRGNAIGQRLVAQLPWGHNIVLLESVSSVGERLAYARLALKNGWSRSVLEHQIEMGAAKRYGKALTNFGRTMPAPDSDLADETLKDEYNLSFLGASETIRENRLRGLLVDRIARFIRQVKAKADGKTIGIVLCKSRDALVVEYALADMKRPAGVATYQFGLPSPEFLQKRLTAELK